MDLKSITSHSMFGILIEGIGFLFAVGAIGYIVIEGGLGEYAKIFAQAICG